jgi:hypothetical protein
VLRRRRAADVDVVDLLHLHACRCRLQCKFCNAKFRDRLSPDGQTLLDDGFRFVYMYPCFR